MTTIFSTRKSPIGTRKKTPALTSPLYAYGHDRGCAIVGGAFYPLLSPQFPDEYAGDYFFADLCGGWIGQYDLGTGTASHDFATGAGWLVAVALAPEGGLYYLERRAGSLVRIDYVGDGQPPVDPVAPVDAPPVIELAPVSQTIAVGQSVKFTVNASGASPLSYQWRRNDVDIPGATQSSYTLARVTMADNGARFSVRVWNENGGVESAAATVTVSIFQKGRQKSSKSVPTPRLARTRTRR